VVTRLDFLLLRAFRARSPLRLRLSESLFIARCPCGVVRLKAIRCAFVCRSVFHQAGPIIASALEGCGHGVKLETGGVGEWLNPAVLKTVRPERVSGVRIPPPPPLIASKRLATMVQAGYKQ
jgi:hypothetical protein